MNTTKATVWTVKRINHFYAGTFGARRDAYITEGDFGYGGGAIIAVANKADAGRIAEELGNSGTYYLAHGEYARPDFEVRRIKNDASRVKLCTMEQACQILELDTDLEVEA